MTRRSRIRFVGLVVVAMALVGCGGQANGGGGGGGGGGDDFPTVAKATSDDAEGTTFQLAEGRYRLAYRAPGCDEVVVNITEVSGEEVYNQHPRGFTTFISNLPAGEYTITVTSDCDEWTVDLNKF